MFELFKVLGSLAGFCSFGFLVWDRITRHRPVVAPTVIYADDKPHVPERYGLIVTNPSNWHCYLTRVTTGNDKVMASTFDDLTDIFRGDTSGATVQVSPRSSVRIFFSDLRDTKDDVDLEITIEWESARHRWPVFKFADRPVRLAVSTKKLESLRVQSETL